jgi:hypothetical protein
VTRPRKRHAPLGTCWMAKRNVEFTEFLMEVTEDVEAHFGW